MFKVGEDQETPEIPEIREVLRLTEVVAVAVAVRCFNITLIAPLRKFTTRQRVMAAQEDPEAQGEFPGLPGSPLLMATPALRVTPGHLALQYV
jgi:hypothetical protein